MTAMVAVTIKQECNISILALYTRKNNKQTKKTTTKKQKQQQKARTKKQQHVNFLKSTYNFEALKFHLQFFYDKSTINLIVIFGRSRGN